MDIKECIFFYHKMEQRIKKHFNIKDYEMIKIGLKNNNFKILIIDFKNEEVKDIIISNVEMENICGKYNKKGKK